MRVKISKLNKAYSTCDIYKVSVKMSGTRRKKVGTIEINYVSESIEVDLGQKLGYKEKLEILKQLFYKLCYSPKEKCMHLDENAHLVNKISFVDEFTFVDQKNDDNEDISLIEELLEYPENVFKDYKKSERLISALNLSNKIIENERKLNSKIIELQPLLYLNNNEIKLYCDILCRYLKFKGYEFSLNNISDRYEYLKNEFGYYYSIIAFEYVEK